MNKLYNIFDEMKENGFIYCGKVAKSPLLFMRNNEKVDIDLVIKGEYCVANYSSCEEIK